MIRIAILILGMAVSAVSFAQAPFYARPSRIPYGLSTNGPLLGGAFTPDGRVLFYADNQPTAYGGWFVKVFRPENLQPHPTTGLPVPIAGAPSPWSTGVQFTFDGMPSTWPNPNPAPPLFDNFLLYGTLAAGPDPAPHADAFCSNYGDLPVPYRSTSNGSYSPIGAYDSYRLVIVAPASLPIDPSSTFSLTNPVFGPPSNFNMAMPLARFEVLVVVSSPRTANAAIASITMSPSPSFLSFTPAGSTAQNPIMAEEPSISRDGHLLIFQGDPANNTLWHQSPFYRNGTIMYSYNQTAFGQHGWSEPRSIAQMHSVDAATIIAGRRFDERYPIAKAPFVDSDGLAISGKYHGAYPWLTMEGTDLVHVAGPNRRALSVIGASTGWKINHIDGPLNPDRAVTQHFVFTGTDISPGIWGFGKGQAQPAIPYTRSEKKLPLFAMQMDLLTSPNPAMPHADGRIYGEVDLDAALDGSYVTYLPMNEAVVPTTPGTSGTWTWNTLTNKTQDLVGSSAPVMSGGAAFPEDYLTGLLTADRRTLDADLGIVGRQIDFPDMGAVTVASNPNLASSKSDFTAEMFVAIPEVVDSPGPVSRFRFLAHQPGAWFMAVDDAGYFSAGFIFGGTPITLPPVGPIPNAGTPYVYQGSSTIRRWTHVAVTYRASPLEIVLYVDGAAAGIWSYPTLTGAPIDGSSLGLVIGPAGQHLPYTPPFNDYIGIDEVYISSTARTAEEIRKHALRHNPTSVPLAPSVAAQLPFGLDAAAVKLPPTAVLSAESVKLGQLLFAETGLSSNGKSCATCHDPGLGFTDGLKVGNGAITSLLRNTPTVVNRMFSTRQFFDGKALSLEDQAKFPIENPNEMASSMSAAVTFLSANTGYLGMFQDAFSSLPSADNIALALAAYQRSLVTGASPFDFHEARQFSLTGADLRGRELFFGKARCFACHDGSNLSNELFHATLLNDSDGGLGSANGRIPELHHFKTPTLRNIADTAPYFHDGSAATLAAVVSRYNAGTARTDGRVDRDIRPLGLTAAEEADLVAFLTNALQGTVISLLP